MQVSVAVRNFSDLPDAQVQQALPAFQHQANYDFAQYWNNGARLHWFEKTATPPETMWRAELYNNAAQATANGVTNIDSAAYGYHDVKNQVIPDMLVFVEEDQKAGLSWTVTFSHELLELLGDPNAAGSVQNGEEFYALEVCDPVEGDALAYELNGIKVSDFVTPAWFQPQRSSMPKFDFGGHLTEPLQVAELGYVSKFTPAQGWRQWMMINGTLTDITSKLNPEAPQTIAGERPRISALARRQAAGLVPAAAPSG